MSGVTTYRPGGVRLVAYASAVILVVMAAVITVALPNEIARQVALSQALTLYGFVVVAVAGLHGVARSKVTVVDAGLVIVNGFRTRQVPWTDIRGFSFSAGAPWPVVVTHADDRIMLFALQGSDGPGRIRDILEDLTRRIP